MPTPQARLEFLDNEKTRESNLGAIVEAADGVIALIDAKELALHFGVNIDEADPKATKERSEMEEKKTALAGALGRKARALIDLRRLAEKPQEPVEAAAGVAAEGGGGDKGVEEGKDATAGTPPPPPPTTTTTALLAPAEEDIAGVLAELAKWDSLDQVSW